MKSKHDLYEEGLALLGTFASDNSFRLPNIKVSPGKSWPYSACAFYREDYIAICLDKCANIGTVGMQWSYPGYVVDRTPYGVLAHELGHRMDYFAGALPDRRGPYWSEFSARMRCVTGEAAITTYCQNDAEWFAEIFRLFMTNPDLLQRLRPVIYGELSARWKPVYSETWMERLKDAPMRTFQAASNKIAVAERQRQKSAA